MTVIRDLPEVIGRLLAIIPAEETEFRSKLQWVAERAIYTAPEIMRQRWHDAQLVISHSLPPLAHLSDWQRKVVAIWMNHE